mmetsp:Transcript_16678/g.22998  ORF Transcript_16678/g.22998 Transcript_16678/m.22998 type:complete len:234 (+) Transcript_16678:165-866(+)|eukprot:CAMPEP_0196582254 /NCGR_PEP_ID=MMETSP1081-20130531/38238_1 /TAXON_ID=36882 /ORGANISM="Pyramimonas amylifera, Strain CCMP720" /LENGTH=233 /DNA_ID=CAMNT_0041902759 /DNA_START=163 /DNA_END=864 /DNA_ORIENTATION=+
MLRQHLLGVARNCHFGNLNPRLNGSTSNIRVFSTSESNKIEDESVNEHPRIDFRKLEPEIREAMEGMLRVDHAGEWGAVRIYEGQLAVLGMTKEAATLEEMAEHERGHLRKFQHLLPKYRVRPTALLPLWDVAGFALGFGSALLGKEAAYAVTVAVETVITEHYNDQLRLLHQTPSLQTETELRKVFKQFRDEEQEHLDTGLERGAEKAPFYEGVTSIVHAGCKGAIWLSKKV